jgi:hypothetical protein
MHDLNQIDETFDINQSNNYFLALQSSKNGFTYFITDTVRNKCLLMRHYRCIFDNWSDYQNFLSSILESDEYLQLNYKRISHIITSTEFSVVPEAFLPDNETALQSFFPEIENPDNYTFFTTPVKESKSVVVFYYLKSLEQILRKRFTHIHLSHQVYPYIHNIVIESNRSLRHVFHLLIQSGSITICVAHMGNLDFVNSFRTETNDDILYYTLAVMEQFKISSTLAEIFVTNEMEIPDTINEKLKSFIGKVRINKPPQNIVYSYALPEENLTRFTNLLNLFNCE